ncbi:MAG: hypothetical protein IKH25_10260 [Muribaculaceae bacterium]|nr:hypothetical protein [Muribaculaceae bacterium]
MIEIRNKVIECINENTVDGLGNEGMTLERCVIHVLNLSTIGFHRKVTIRNCIIDKLNLHCTWFTAGLDFVGNVILSDIDYQMGGHNNDVMVISENVFHGFFDFFDCHFEERLNVENNIFMKGTDLLKRENKGFDNYFNGGVVLSGNIGQLNIWPTTVN